MTDLNWLTPQGIYLHYLNDAESNDGTLVVDLIHKWQGELAYENSVFEMTGAQAEDRWEYKRNTKPLRTLIRKAETGVLELMMRQAEIGRWIGIGRRTPDAEEEVIAFRNWPFLHLDGLFTSPTHIFLILRDISAQARAFTGYGGWPAIEWRAERR